MIDEDEELEICEYCKREYYEECDRRGWLPGKDYPDGSWISMHPCPNDNSHYEISTGWSR